MSVAEDDRRPAGSPYDPPHADPNVESPGGSASWFYYGWVMLPVAAIAMVATFPGRTQGLGTVTQRLLADESLGLDEASYGLLNMIATLVGAAFCLGFGRLIDRCGMRIVLPVTLLGLGGAVVGMAVASNVALFFVLLTLTRGFGQSALSVASISIPGKWFRAWLSPATAIYSVLLTIGFIAAFMLAREWSDANWRTMWLGVGLIVLALAPLAWLLTRNGPEAVGAFVDGRASNVFDLPTAQATGVGLFAAMATLDFWVFAGATSLYATISSGISLFNESILLSLGFEKQVYYDSMMIAIGFGLLGNFATGLAAIWIPMGRLTAVGLAGLTVSLVALTQLTEVWHVYVYAMGYAFAGGMVTVIFFAVWAKRFGRRHLGSIQGVAQMTTVFASAIGPALFGYVFQTFGSYGPVLLGLSVVSAGLAAVAFFVPERSFADESSLPSQAPAGQD
jgi:MFS family permease